MNLRANLPTRVQDGRVRKGLTGAIGEGYGYSTVQWEKVGVR